LGQSTNVLSKKNVTATTRMLTKSPTSTTTATANFMFVLLHYGQSTNKQKSFLNQLKFTRVCFMFLRHRLYPLLTQIRFAESHHVTRYLLKSCLLNKQRINIQMHNVTQFPNGKIQ